MIRKMLIGLIVGVMCCVSVVNAQVGGGPPGGGGNPPPPTQTGVLPEWEVIDWSVYNDHPETNGDPVDETMSLRFKVIDWNDYPPSGSNKCTWSLRLYARLPNGTWVEDNIPVNSIQPTALNQVYTLSYFRSESTQPQRLIPSGTNVAYAFMYIVTPYVKTGYNMPPASLNPIDCVYDADYDVQTLTYSLLDLGLSGTRVTTLYLAHCMGNVNENGNYVWPADSSDGIWVQVYRSGNTHPLEPTALERIVKRKFNVWNKWSFDMQPFFLSQETVHYQLSYHLIGEGGIGPQIKVEYYDYVWNETQQKWEVVPVAGPPGPLEL
jgi:hypothetical protein